MSSCVWWDNCVGNWHLMRGLWHDMDEFVPISVLVSWLMCYGPKSLDCVLISASTSKSYQASNPAEKKLLALSSVSWSSTKTSRPIASILIRKRSSTFGTSQDGLSLKLITTNHFLTLHASHWHQTRNHRHSRSRIRHITHYAQSRLSGLPRYHPYA